MNFTSKMSTLVGPLYGGLVLDIIGLNQQDLPGTVAQPVLHGLMYAVLLISVPTLAISIWLAYRIHFSKEQLDTIQAALGEDSMGRPSS
jgi:GPH family glycoside/pentoside/hexuronide:cation symporter